MKSSSDHEKNEEGEYVKESDLYLDVSYAIGSVEFL